MQHSLAIIASNEGAIGEIVDDGVNGFLVPKMNVDVLADKIELLLKNRTLVEKMGKAGRLKYERQYTLEKFENRMVEILEEVERKFQ